MSLGILSLNIGNQMNKAFTITELLVLIAMIAIIVVAICQSCHISPFIVKIP